MRLVHSAVTSSIFELAKVVELDVQFGDDSYTMRIELLRDTEHENRFRCHVWELERFLLTPTFPVDERGQPAHLSSDVLMVDRGISYSRIKYPREDIVAPDIDSALEVVMDDLKNFLEYATFEKAK